MEFAGFDHNFSLAGKVALITGGAAGIGRAIAHLFHQKGANLFLVDLNPSVQDTAKQIDADLARVGTITASITVPEEREQAVEAALARFGRIDILVNNAGWLCLISQSTFPPITGTKRST